MVTLCALCTICALQTAHDFDGVSTRHQPFEFVGVSRLFVWLTVSTHVFTAYVMCK